MSTWDERSLIEDVLANGVDDWIYAGWVYQIARRSGITDPSQLRQLSIGIIADLLLDGLAIAGEYNGTEHRAWECSSGEAVARIAEDWLHWGNDAPTPGAIVWLDLTAAGREIGEAVLAREQSS